MNSMFYISLYFYLWYNRAVNSQRALLAGA
jgi:hypothetical protein